ncbi:DUF3102 domain-containing protein [Pelagibacterium sp.]|uniref:DUF3102 domain-containing protein n=1 Tax=Pelagibacterium sp. TaxID=1967288 RepID=UPI003BA98DE6
MRTPYLVFSTDRLSSVEVELLTSAEKEVRSALEMQSMSIIDAGRALSRVKAQLEHGVYSLWISARFPFSIRTAQNYVNVFEKLGKHHQLVAHFSPTTLYALASDAASDVRQQVLDEIESGKLAKDDEIKSRLLELVPKTSPNDEGTPGNGVDVQDLESSYSEAVDLFQGWRARKKLARLIDLLRELDPKELADRLEHQLLMPQADTQRQEPQSDESRTLHDEGAPAPAP